MTDPRDTARAANHAATIARQDVGRSRGMDNGVTWSPASNATTIAANRLAAAEQTARVFGGTPEPFQSDYRVGTDGWLNDNQIYNGVNTHNAFTTNGWSGNSAFLNSQGDRLNYYGGQVTNADPYPTPTNPGGGGGGGSYGQSLAQRQAAWEKYQKDYLAMVAGFRPTEVGPAPVDDLTPLVNQAVDADLAHNAATYGDVVPMDANAYQTTPRATTPSAAMYGGGLMDGQGFDSASAEQNQIRRQGELNADAYLWDQHWAGEDARTEQFNSARNADVMTLTANAKRRIESQRASLLAAAGVKYQDEMDVYGQQQAAARNADARRKEEAAMALLQQAMSSGLDISGLDLSGFMGGA